VVGVARTVGEEAVGRTGPPLCAVPVLQMAVCAPASAAQTHVEHAGCPARVTGQEKMASTTNLAHVFG
jgi:hypothetical protein